MIPTSYGQAYLDMAVTGVVFSVLRGEASFLIAGFVLGTAGWNSCMLATYIHNRMHK